MLKILGEIVKMLMRIFDIWCDEKLEVTPAVKILDNSRQVPKVKEYTADQRYCDYLYGYLQRMSCWDGVIGHPRYIWKKSVNFSKIGKDLGKTRQTIAKKFKMMVEGELPLIR